MKLAKVMLVWIGCVLITPAYASFKPKDWVKLCKGKFEGQEAQVKGCFSKMWPGEKISEHTEFSLVVPYMQQLRAIGVHNFVDIERNTYLVYVGKQGSLACSFWMEKIADPEWDMDQKLQKITAVAVTKNKLLIATLKSQSQKNK